MKKRILSILLAIVMVISLLPVTALAGDLPETYTSLNGNTYMGSVISGNNDFAQYNGKSATVVFGENTITVTVEGTSWTAEFKSNQNQNTLEYEKIDESSRSLISIGASVPIDPETSEPMVMAVIVRVELDTLTVAALSKHVHNHDHYEAGTGTNLGKHISKCICGASLGDWTIHSFTNGYTKDETNHPGKHAPTCVCGADNGIWVDHDFTSGDCVCGAKNPYAVTATDWIYDPQCYDVYVFSEDTKYIFELTEDLVYGKEYVYADMCPGWVGTLDDIGNLDIAATDATLTVSKGENDKIHIDATMTLSGNVHTITYDEPAATTYTITNGTAQDANGSITVAKTAAKDDTVTVTVTPNDGYQLKSLKYNDGTDHEITADAQGAYKFTMPAKDVTVTATFEAATEIDCPDCTDGMQHCNTCHDTRKCDECDGFGTCNACRGSGTCGTCHGVNSEGCYGCDGTGKCDSCNNGECRICKGDKKCKDCKPCETCGGTGKVAAPTTCTYTVTFPEGPEQVYIIGDTSNWQTFTPMTMTSKTTATITLDTPFAEYKYTAGAAWAYVEKDAQSGEIGNRIACANPDVVGSWAAVPAPASQYHYTTYANWQIKHEGNGWEFADMTKVEDGLFIMPDATWKGSGFNVASGANPIKKNWYAADDSDVTIGEEVIAPVIVDIYLRVIDDETLKIGVGEAPVLTYDITDGTTDTNGSITVAKTAAKDDTVTVTVTSGAGYMLDTLTVVPTAGGDAIATTQDTQDTTKYTFTMPAYAVTVTATFREKGDDVKYIDETGAEKTGDAKKLTSTSTEWSGTVYITENTTIDGKVTLTGNTTLILGDGAKLTVTKGITSNSKTLTVFAQKGGTGELYVTGENGADIDSETSADAGQGAPAAKYTTLILHGGKATFKGGNGGNGSGAGGCGNTGGAGISGSCTVTGGELIAIGGNGGNSGIHYSARSGSFAITGHCTVTGSGKVTATGGNGGIGGLGNGEGYPGVPDGYINGVVVSRTPVSGTTGETVVVWGHPREIEGKGTKAEPWKIGDTEGDTLTAYLDGTKLVIEGAGKMTDFSADDSFEAPWSPEISSVEIGSEVTGIGAYAFKGAGLSEVVIPAKVESIGAGAFKDCASLTKVTVQPAHIGDNYAIIPVTLGADAFDGCTALRTILVRQGFGDTYKAAENWNSYSDKIVERTDYDVKVLTKDGKTATEGFWYTPSGAVNITKDGLVLTGKTTGERVVVCEGVTELTLRDLTIDLDSPKIVCIQKTGDDTLTLNIEGTVKVTGQKFGIDTQKSLTIGGTGSLAVTSEKSDSIVVYGDLIIKDSVNVTATAFKFVAIYGDKDIAISTSGRVEAYCDDASAIACNGALTIGGTGSLAVTSEQSNGISAKGDLIIKDSVNVTATSEQSDGIAAEGDLIIKDSVNVTATGSNYTALWGTKAVTISTSGRVEAYCDNASALGSSGNLTIAETAKNIVAHGFMSGECGALELYSADALVLPEGWGILGSKDMNAAVKDMKIAAVLHQVPEHDNGLNAYTGYIGTEDFAKSVTFGPVVTLSFPKAEGASYVAKIGAEGMEVFTTEAEGNVSFPVAIGTTNVVITTMTEQGYLVKGENPYVINSVNASTKIDSGKLPAVVSSKEYLEKLDDALAGNAQSESGVFEVTEKDGVRTVKLLTDLSMTYEDSALTIPEGADVVLDLNGHTIDRGLSGMDPADKGNVFINNGKLTIRDSSTAQTGTITGGNATFGGAILSNGDTILESGTIFGCEAYGNDYDTASSRLGRGGAIYVPYTGSFTMTGGAIKDCKANVAGGAIFNIGSVTITGGTISGCYVSGLEDGGTVKAKGGAVYNYGYSSFTMTGGKISDNTTGDVEDMRGAGVYAAANANITLGGTAQIVGNTDGAGNASNLFLYDSVTVKINTENPPKTGMSVGVTMKTPGQFMTDGTEDLVKFFTSDSKNYYVNFNDGLELKAPEDGENIVHVESGTGGVISTDKQVAEQGEDVSISTVPDGGYRVAGMIVKDADGNVVPVTKSTDENGNTVFTFTQPEKAVTVEPIFATGGLNLPEETTVTGEEGEKKITSGEDEVEITTSNGVELPETALDAVAAQINTVLDNDTVKGFGLTEDETGLDKATEKKDSTIVNSLKAKTTDTTAKDNVSETSISKYLDVKLVSASVNAGMDVTVTAMTFDVTPMATITVIGEDHEPVTLTAKITNDEVDGTVTFLLPVDKSIMAATAAVYHEGAFIGNYEIKTDGSGNQYIEVTTDSFSEFGYITLDETTAGAKIDTTLYASLSDAVSEVQDDETIKLLKNASGTITVSRAVKFTVDANGKTNTATITAGSGYTVSKSSDTYTVTKNSGGGGGGGASSYAINLPTNVKNGKVEVSPKNASAGQTVTLTVTPDKGFTLETLTVLDKNGKEVEVKDLGNGKYSFKMPSGKVTISATFMEDNTMLNFFVDVKATDYFYDAVLWAAENGITNGVDATHFNPFGITTRGQMVTFLWRAAGCPEPTASTCKFTDVKADAYYYKAVLWAIEQGITKGTSETTFSPDMNVSRGQMVTFLARMSNVKDDASGYSHGFADVGTADYFNNAVAWAAANNITNGTSATTFSPNDDCLRGQIVTFLYRYFVK